MIPALGSARPAHWCGGTDTGQVRMIDGMEPVQVDEATFAHIRVILGVVTSLAIARILNGLAGFAQNRRRNTPYLVHTLWAIFLLLLTAHFWWFEFALAKVTFWPFETYAFLIFFASLHFFTAALLFPDQLDEGAPYEDYFFEHRGWFFGFLGALFLFDMVDTALKGPAHFASLGALYPVRQVSYAIACLAAIRWDNRRFHLALVIAFLVLEAAWIVERYAD
ncbi:hypothetical protein Ga0102493_11108 [Erythrobacter litoralis]|nr:hypothetical protein Ga0102493_11108 [Erythrobacter litoralis]